MSKTPLMLTGLAVVAGMVFYTYTSRRRAVRHPLPGTVPVRKPGGASVIERDEFGNPVRSWNPGWR